MGEWVNETKASRILGAGDRVPHFEVVDSGGARVRYADLWQVRNLLLISLPDGDPAAADRAAEVCARIGSTCDDVACVATRAALPGMPRPGYLIADKWGEIMAVEAGDPPGVPQLIDWLNFVRHQCPECQGEAL